MVSNIPLSSLSLIFSWYNSTENIINVVRCWRSGTDPTWCSIRLLQHQNAFMYCTKATSFYLASLPDHTQRKGISWQSYFWVTAIRSPNHSQIISKTHIVAKHDFQILIGNSFLCPFSHCMTLCAPIIDSFIEEKSNLRICRLLAQVLEVLDSVFDIYGLLEGLLRASDMQKSHPVELILVTFPKPRGHASYSAYQKAHVWTAKFPVFRSMYA